MSHSDKMIVCKICKKNKSESQFSMINFELGYPAICIDCIMKYPERTEQMQLETIEHQQIILEKQQQYELEKQNKIRNQIYEGQYDWM